MIDQLRYTLERMISHTQALLYSNRDLRNLGEAAAFLGQARDLKSQAETIVDLAHFSMSRAKE